VIVRRSWKVPISSAGEIDTSSNSREENVFVLCAEGAGCMLLLRIPLLISASQKHELRVHTLEFTEKISALRKASIPRGKHKAGAINIKVEWLFYYFNSLCPLHSFFFSALDEAQNSAHNHKSCIAARFL
jgi:hypothetical protein